MKLEDIGFYTLSDERAETSNSQSPLMRCELILTDKCNFKCPYCRGIRPDFNADLSFSEALSVVDAWISHGLKNIRFSGGEPTVWSGNLIELVKYAKRGGIEHIALSTNGSAPLITYLSLVNAGVNDFSISLDACCASYAQEMSGGVNVWNNLVNNIRELSQLTYTTVGIVINESNISQLQGTIELSDSLGVSDIRVISAAQYNQLLDIVKSIDTDIVNRHPILKYRLNNIIQGRNVRGIQSTDSCKCPLALDDMVIMGGYHFPCIIYMREGGDPIGKFDASNVFNMEDIRNERKEWIQRTNTHCNPICQQNCLDVCIDFNNKWMELNKERNMYGIS